ncbi:bifunctional UDP-2,4-diacetamido-2,4,6-trideoxy-beta-L-altropyranose hydrolase/GNAT family N-acetyltransferase [Microbacterium sp. 3J1]|uniref:bifunctional UDP-2,4-diacetamido-2,4,6-trideoxy-beta-L-altropyranose hydrolase/GNAT family N-acetyltransferase n=1 Tax=Microbacterium sp. 3J1 TaxID=861269 RepID=UPI000A9542AF|nr:bifunctional UDP-2,4-diacetamido-2,4,6-trideoxy-beta-L-altropyranose hydrolase/GNAT family N-acetyltransferase [Microbacterium sp. 3J1]
MGQRRAVLHCNASTETGMGHLMRTLTIAQTARRRGWSVRIIGDIDEAAAGLASRAEPGVDVESVAGAALPAALTAATMQADVVHVDSYAEVPDLASSPALISNMQDGPFGVRAADLSIDANLGAEASFERPDLSRNPLAGVDLAVVREQVLRQRDAPRRESALQRVLVVMGGSDPQGLTARVTRALDGIARPLAVTVVDPRGRGEVHAAAQHSAHDVRVIGFVDDLPAVAREHDLVVTAAGTSVWDFACMGLPMALVCAVDNQRPGYDHVVSRGLAVGLGAPPHDDLEERIGALDALLADGGALAAQAARLRQTVDGRGAWRIVASWEQLVDTASDTVPDTGPAPASAGSRSPSPMMARAATLDDARMLFDWRNDPATRANSRTRGAVDWDAHVAWLARVVGHPDRRLLIVESEGHPVATSRWDRHSDTDWELSITMAPEYRGRGLASAVLAASERALSVDAPTRLLAIVHGENTASLRLFRANGYLPHLPPDGDGFLAFAKWRLVGSRTTADPR